MSVLVQDVRYAIRRLVGTPLFSLFAILILAIGIGLNVTVFGIVDAMLWRSAPFADPDRIVHIYQDSDGGEPSSTAYPAYRDIAEMTDVFASVTAQRSATANFETTDGATEVAVDFVTASYFSVHGLTPARGRWFDAAHDAVGAEMVAVVTDKAWRTRFASEDVLGRTIKLNNQPITIIGVGPPGFNGQAGAVNADFWLSISSVAIGGPFMVANLERRQDHWYSVKARLLPGVTLEHARGALAGLAARHGELFPEIDRGRDITLFALGEVRVHPRIDAVLAGSGTGLFVIGGIVLLLACANLGNLLLARGLSRAPELAIREALGGDRKRVGRPLLLEALLLAALGGAFGLLAALWLGRFIASVPLPPVNQALDVRFDYRVVLFSIAAAFGTGCLFGLLPARRSASRDVAAALHEAGRAHSSSAGASWLRAALVAGQVALSIVLLVGTALLGRSFVNAERVDPGVDVERIAVIGTNLLQAGVTLEETDAVSAAVLERIRALPGVENAALTIRLPLSTGPTSSTIVEGYELPRGTNAIEMPITSVSRDYFATMGIPLLAGRAFTAADRRESPAVVVVNETAARTFFGGNAVGRRVRAQDDAENWREVVGVVGDVKVGDLQEPPTPLMYLTTQQTGAGGFSVVVRTLGDPAGVLAALPSALREVRSSLPVTSLELFESYLADALVAARASALLIGAFAALALVLAGLGIYATVSFSVERRRHELGIRVALGATSTRLIGMVVGSSLKLACAGVAVGLLLAVVAARGLQALLFGVAPFDGASFATAALLLVAAAALAAFVPALRVVRAAPTDVLRNQ